MSSYRLYCLDGAGRIVAAEWIQAEDDGAALEAAEEIRDGRRCELWRGKELVARLAAASGG